MGTLLQDVRYGLRTLRKSPGFTAVAVITLALGIGINSAMFSVVNGVLLQPLPYKDAGRLVVVNTIAREKGQTWSTSPVDFRALREGNHTFENLSAAYAWSLNLTGREQPEVIRASAVSYEYFATLGVTPLLGSTFLADEEQWGHHLELILSEDFWRTHLGADPNVCGKTLRLNEEQYNIVGIMPRSLKLLNSTQVWIPMAWAPNDNLNNRNNHFLNVVGRLRTGITEQQADADLNTIMHALAQQFPENKGLEVGLRPLHESLVGNIRLALLVLLGAVGFVLLIGCVNLANLLLARAAGRRKETAVRLSLGATKGRLLRQFLTESLLLSLAGATFGLGLAYFYLRLLPLARNVLPSSQQIRLDGWVLVFTFATSILTGVLFGLAPALQNSRMRLSAALNEAGRNSETASKNWLRSSLVIGEVAISVVLLVGAGLTITSFVRLLQADPGFDPRHVLTFEVNLPKSYSAGSDPHAPGAPPRVAIFLQELLKRLEELPGVQSAGTISSLPLRGEVWGKRFVPMDHALPTSMDKIDNVQFRVVGGRYFNSMGIRLIRGRLFHERDLENSPPVVVINETLAHKYWPGGEPLGKIIMLAPPENLIPRSSIPPGYHVPRLTIVGIVADVHYGGLDKKTAPTVYGSFLQTEWSSVMAITVRSEGDPLALVSAARNQLRQLDKNLPMVSIATMNDIVSNSVAQPRLESVLLGLFGALALTLAAVGIYGVMSYAVSQRTSEIGIRMALGADRFAVLKMIIGEGLRMVGIGVSIGLALALALTRVLARLLFGVSPTDPLTFASIVVLLTLIALFACYIPARRATKVDPIVALRYE